MRVLIVTGALLSVNEVSLWRALAKQLASARASTGPWLDIRFKLMATEHLLAQHRMRKRMTDEPYAETVRRLYAHDFGLGAPELTEVLLMTLLQREGLDFEVATFAELHGDPALRRAALDRCSVVFASSTLLRDESELNPMAGMLKRPDNRVVVGGALANLLGDFGGSPDIDVLAVGSGELLVPALAEWIRGEPLVPPAGGSLGQLGATAVLRSGSPVGRSLDGFVAPDWALAERVHGRRFPMVYYESVRGCPYRCAFCNYPYLFDDTRFRVRSAQRIAVDWQAYAEGGATYVTCLDSLFTIPPRRLIELCERLIALDLGLRWICYARSDDLCTPETVRLMRRAGCVQVQIGAESGDDAQLSRMDKRCTVAQNDRAIAVCRDEGISTLCTFIAGYPGETEATLRSTRDFILRTRPDFYYFAPFTTRVLGVPILSDASRATYGIRTSQGLTSSAPYWRHATLSAEQLPALIRAHNRAVIDDMASLDATLFYQITVPYRPADRADLLHFQRDAFHSAKPMRRAFSAAGWWVQRQLERDLERVLN